GQDRQDGEDGLDGKDGPARQDGENGEEEHGQDDDHDESHGDHEGSRRAQEGSSAPQTSPTFGLTVPTRRRDRRRPAVTGCATDDPGVPEAPMRATGNSAPTASQQGLSDGRGCGGEGWRGGEATPRSRVIPADGGAPERPSYRARPRNCVRCSRNARRTLAVGPLRCLAMMTSAVPLSSESGL